jgi:hypothetical protein
MALQQVPFDGQGDQVERPPARAWTQPQWPSQERSYVPAVIDLRSAEARSPVYPTLIPDAQAVAVVRSQTQGHLSNRETLAWVHQSWIRLYRIRTDFTSKAGLRGELRYACWHQLFDSISGQPIKLAAPRDLPALGAASPSNVPIRMHVSVAEVIAETVHIWNNFCAIEDKGAYKRQTAVLTARGVPAAVANSINVEFDCELLLPVFIGLLTHSTGHRLMVLDGVGGKLQPRVTAGTTTNFRDVVQDLKHSRLLSLGV